MATCSPSRRFIVTISGTTIIGRAGPPSPRTCEGWTDTFATHSRRPTLMVGSATGIGRQATSPWTGGYGESYDRQGGRHLEQLAPAPERANRMTPIEPAGGAQNWHVGGVNTGWV